jgi:sensor domain CHASE-containing protein
LGTLNHPLSGVADVIHGRVGLKMEFPVTLRLNERWRFRGVVQTVFAIPLADALNSYLFIRSL